MALNAKSNVPRILLVGLGRFGRQHLEVWRSIEARGLAELAGAVVATEESREKLIRVYDFPISARLTPALLKNIDGVDIVTPMPAHFENAMTCLPHASVLVEKPLAASRIEARTLQAEAKRSGHALKVNHVYRFDPVVQKLKALIAAEKGLPRLITGIFINPVELSVERLCPNLEMLHYFDVIDFLFARQPTASFTERAGCVNSVSVRYSGGMNAVFELGWRGNDRIRTFNVVYAAEQFRCDLLGGSIEVSTRDRLDRYLVPRSRSPLTAALESFAQTLRGREAPPANELADARVGARILDVAIFAAPRAIRSRPRVAVIGGGIFGATCAVELGRHHDVTLLERHPELLTEASYLNQWRHHSGFHYPRSLQTVQEIQAARDEFHSAYDGAVDQNVASYYCTSKHGREITRDGYLAFCSENRLAFSVEDPPAGLVDPDQITLCLKTDESVLDFQKLRGLVKTQLVASGRIRTQMGAEVIEAGLARDGSKILAIRTDATVRRETYDYVINATYSNSNLLSKWLRFPVHPLRFDLCEMLVLEMPAPQVSITVLDGPFSSLVSTSEPGIFLLSHMYQSILKSRTPRNGLPPDWGPVQSNRKLIVENCARYFPLIRKAKIVESRFSTRAVTACSDDVDGRPTTVTNHGFGCWSILGGKIATCVSNARQIAGAIARATA